MEWLTSDERPPEVRISKISSDWKLSLKFTMPIQFPDELRESINAIRKTPNAPIDVLMISSKNDKKDENLTDWSISKLSSTEIDIDLVFSQPTEVSQDEKPDILVVEIRLSEYKGQNGKYLDDRIIKKGSIPSQIVSKSEAEAISDIGTAM